MNPKIDAFLGRAKKWQREMEQLRKVALDCGLTEELKWGKPCYAYRDKNIVIIQGFKEYCALLFFKGYLLSDPDTILVKTGENTVVGRQIRFTSVQEINKLHAALKSYIFEAVDVEKTGLKGPDKINKELIVPEELQNKLDESHALKAAFEALTPGRKKGYILYFSQPKQSKTRTARIEKNQQRIMAGKGLND